VAKMEALKTIEIEILEETRQYNKMLSIMPYKWRFMDAESDSFQE
jgi:hypothetical protein